MTKSKLKAMHYRISSSVVLADNGLRLCVVALSRNLKLTTTLDRAITQNPCYVPFLFKLWNKKKNLQEN